MKTAQVILTVVIGLSCLPKAVGQRVDKWFWPSAQVQTEFFNHLGVSLDLEARIDQNYSNLRSFFGELETKWKFNKYLTTSIAYRLGGRQADISDYAKGQRITLFVYGKVDIWKFSLTNRTGVFRQFLENTEAPVDYLREKLTLRFSLLKKVTPLAYGEFFYRLDSDPKKIDEYRIGGGVEYDITKHHQLKALYIHTQQVNVKKVDIRHVWSFAYTYKIKFKKKEKEGA